MVRICESPGFIDDPSQAANRRSQFAAVDYNLCAECSGFPSSPRLNESMRVFDVNNLGLALRIHGQSENVRVGLAEVDKARRNKRIHKPIQLELPNRCAFNSRDYVG